MKGRDLIVIQVRSDEALRGQCPGQTTNHLDLDTKLFKTLHIIRSVFAHRRDGNRMPAQQFQVVSDITRATTKLTAHPRD